MVGPVVSGRRYVRELRMTQLAGIAMAGSSSANGEPEAKRVNSNRLEAGGFSLSAATLESLARVDLAIVSAPAVGSMLILDNDKLPTARRWAESLSDSGIELEYRAMPGLIEMAMTAPQFATVPHTMIDSARRWLTAAAALTQAGSSTGLSSSDPPAAEPATPLIASYPSRTTESRQRHRLPNGRFSYRPAPRCSESSPNRALTRYAAAPLYC